MADITKFPKIDKVTLEDKVTPNDGNAKNITILRPHHLP